MDLVVHSRRAKHCHFSLLDDAQMSLQAAIVDRLRQLHLYEKSIKKWLLKILISGKVYEKLRELTTPKRLNHL
jgi:hypothetical protein